MNTPKRGFSDRRHTHRDRAPVFGPFPPLPPLPPGLHCTLTASLNVSLCHVPMLGETLPLGGGLATAGGQRAGRPGAVRGCRHEREARDGGLMKPLCNPPCYPLRSGPVTSPWPVAQGNPWRRGNRFPKKTGAVFRFPLSQFSVFHQRGHGRTLLGYGGQIEGARSGGGSVRLKPRP